MYKCIRYNKCLFPYQAEGQMLEWVPRKAEEAPSLQTAQTHPDKTWSSLIYLALFCAGSCRR